MSQALRRFLKNAIFMAAAALLMRTVAVSYHAYLSGRIGAEGMGLFALVMSIYTFAVTFATSGVQLAVTRLVSESLGQGYPGAARIALRRATGYALVFSGVGTTVMFFCAPFFGVAVLGDPRTVLSIRILALTLIPIALCSVMSGYFTAVHRVLGISVTQVTEQVIRILLTVFLLRALAPRGMEYACAAVVTGGAAAQVISCALLALQYMVDRIRFLRDRGKAGEGCGMNRRLFHIALPVAFSAYIRSGLLTVEHILIPRALTRGGRRSREEALSTYGILDGMALPVVLYPMAVLSSFSGLLVPVFAERRARGESRQIDSIASRALHLTTVFAVGCAACLLVFARDLGIAVYSSEAAGNFIRILAPVVPLMFLDHVTDCVLKGIGEQVYSMWVNIADSAISIAMVCLFLPSVGAVGYVFVIVIAEAFNFTLSIGRLCRVVHLRYSAVRALLFPGIAAAVAAVAVRALFHIDPYTATLPWLLCEMLFSMVCYLGVLTVFSCIFGKEKEGKRSKV